MSCCRVVVLSCGRVDVLPWCSHVAGGCVVVGLWRHLVLWRCGRVAQDLCDCVVLCLCDTVSVSCSCVAVALCLPHWCCGRVVALLGDCMVVCACSCDRVAVWLCGCAGAWVPGIRGGGARSPPKGWRGGGEGSVCAAHEIFVWQWCKSRTLGPVELYATMKG